MSLKFRGKTQKMHEKPSPINIRTIAQISFDRHYRILCPVRALAHYKRRTAKLRQGQKAMFVCHKKGKNSTTASKATLARWVKETISHAYSDKYSSTPARKITAKMHDLRAVFPLSLIFAIFSQIILQFLSEILSFEILPMLLLAENIFQGENEQSFSVF